MKITKSQLEKWNAGAGQGFRVDVQNLLTWGEKSLHYVGEKREDESYFVVSLKYYDETEGAGYSAKRTGKQIIKVSVDRYVPVSSGMCRLDCLFCENVGDPQNKKMFSYMQKLSHEINLAEYLERAEAMRPLNAKVEPVSILEMIEQQNAEQATKTAEQAAETAEPETTAQETETTEEQPETAAEQPETGPNGVVSEGMTFSDASGAIHTITKLSDMSVEFNNGVHSLFDFGTSRTISAICDALGTGSRLIFDPSEADQPEVAKEQPEVEAEQPEIAEIEEPETAEQNPACDSSEMTEEQPETTEQPESMDNLSMYSSDMFETLARAFITGKQAPKKPVETQDKPQVVEITPETEQAPQEEEKPKEQPGYFSNDNDRFTPEQLSTLANGGQIESGEGHNNNAYFTIQHSENARLVYSVHMWEQKYINPDTSHKYIGFIVSGNLYTDKGCIVKELNRDIEDYLRDFIPDQTSAAHIAANVDEWKRRDIDNALEYDFTETAERLFYDGKAPELSLFHADYGDTDNLIDYIKNPVETVFRLAQRYISESPEKIYLDYIRYNKTLAKYNAILENPDHSAHMIKRIRSAITYQKTVRIEIRTGKELKVESSALKRISETWGISSWDILSQDRSLLPLDENGRPRDIKPSDIVAIYHGGKTLYRAS